MGRTITIHFVDRDVKVRAEAARQTLALGHHAEVYSELDELGKHLPREGIVVASARPDAGEVKKILTALSTMSVALPLVIASESTSVDGIVEAVRAGALDYLPLPLDQQQLGAMIARTAGHASAEALARRRLIEARARINRLSEREREVLELLMDGGSNKQIARDLAISPRTVEIHRANMMQKLEAKHVAEAVRMYFEAEYPRARFNRRF